MVPTSLKRQLQRSPPVAMVASCGGAQELGAQGDGLRSKAAVSYASVGPWEGECSWNFKPRTDT